MGAELISLVRMSYITKSRKNLDWMTVRQGTGFHLGRNSL